MDCMLDLETLGVKPGCVVLTAAVVAFHPDNKPEEDKEAAYVRFDIPQMLLAGLRVEADTQDWWLGQSNDAKSEAFTAGQGVGLLYGLNELSKVFALCSGNVWAQGASFDFPILNHLYTAAGLKAPWPFWAERDTRTLYDAASIFGFDRKLMDKGRAGTHHTALDDCRHQIACVRRARACMKTAIRAVMEPNNVAKAT